MSESPKGWPDTDPYPFRDVPEDFNALKEVADCIYVTCDKKYAKSADLEEPSNYSYTMERHWKHINELTQKIKDLEGHIQWLKNIGGERLNLACGIDIVCRDMVIAKRKDKAVLALAKE